MQVIGLNAIFFLGTERSIFFSSHNKFACFAPGTPTQSARVFPRATFALKRISFKRLALLKPTTRILSETFPCSLSGVNSKCISESTFLRFESTE